MSLPVRLLPEAKAEFDAAADWYEQQRPGLGVDFIARVRVVLNRIGTHPRIHAAVYGDVRKAVVAQLPVCGPVSRRGGRGSRHRGVSYRAIPRFGSREFD